MKKLVTLFCFCIISTFISAQPPTDKRLAGLDSLAARVLKDWHAPGVAIAVVEKNKVVYAGGFGYRDVEKKLPVTENTQFGIASCTKAFTASLIGMLEKEGKLDLDKPVRDYLPELKFFNENLNSHVTLRDMMCHRTGIPQHLYAWYGSTATRSELLKRIQYLEPSAELRQKWQYNNFMYMAQGVVVEKLTGKSWEDMMQEKILNQLGMNNTNMSATDMEKSTDRSLAYTLKNDSIITAIPYRNIDAMGPAGSVNSCAKDMANWLITWINGGKFEGKEIIPASYVIQAMTVQMATDGGPPDPGSETYLYGYGLGWGAYSYRGHYRVEHVGGLGSFISSTVIFPSDSIGIFVVSCQSGVTTSLRHFIADRMLRLPYRNWHKKPQVAETKQRINSDSMNRISGTQPSHSLNDYVGLYENPGYGQMKLFLLNDTLWTNYFEERKKATSYLIHYHYDVFRIRSTEEEEENTNALKVRFITNDKGKIASMEIQMEQGVNDIVFKKLPPAIKAEKKDLEKYTGEYVSRSFTAKIFIRGDNTLMVLVPSHEDGALVRGPATYELTLVNKDEFNLITLSGYSIRFDENDKNEVTALNFIQPNGTFRATRKK